MQPEPGASRLFPATSQLSRLPWWILAAALLGILFTWQITTDITYEGIVTSVVDGLVITVFVTIVSYTLAIVLGLALVFARLSKSPVIYQVSTFFVEIIRGVPMLVVILYVAFVFVPGVVQGFNSLGHTLVNSNIPVLTSIGTAFAQFNPRDISNVGRGIVALVIGYSVFLSEVFRAGIESIDRGQMEAGRSLGMTYWQTMRYVILPQAIRNVMPALGNDFISMLKDSSLVSVLGVRDITRSGQVLAAANFRYFETYNVIAFFYLTMTLLLSLGVRWLERRSTQDRQKD
jgi:His/Glu/Gln/Arg/opine family amino acid ABC transporter permease subunit